ncbi:MAG: signaling protein, partial [Gemmataceae bacterium]
MKHSPALLAALVMASTAAAEDVHVRPDGPVRTLADAQREARKRRANVTVHAGTYYLPETLVLTAEDAGTEYRAADGEPVVLSGGRKLDLTWEAVKGGVLRAATPAGLTFDQLFVNGRRQTMARYPNYDPAVRPFGGFAADAFGPARAARWADPTGGIIHAMHAHHWGGFQYRITGKNDQGEVTREGGWQNNRQSGMHPQHRFVENVFEELDAPGEWFHDARTNTLYYLPPAGVDVSTAVVEVAGLRHLVEFRGSRAAPVRNVTLRGFVFRHAARTFMDTKEPLLRSDWTVYRGGAVLFDGAEDCALIGCEVDQPGGNGVFVSGYNRRVAVRGCDVHDTGASGVAFVGHPKAVRNPLFEYGQRLGYAQIDKTPGPRTDDYPADCVVEDCLV